MTWNYRIVEETIRGNKYYQIKEVYYDKQDNIIAFSKEAISPGGETLEDLRKDLEFMLEAFNSVSLPQEELDNLFNKTPKNSNEDKNIPEDNTNLMDNFID